jgi:polyhydroxyalkanoate synthesis regulator phasin
MKTKVTVLTLVLALMLSVTGLAAAQPGPDDRPNRPDRPRVQLLGQMADVLTEATGLTPLEIREQVQDGATLAEVIESSGASVDAIVSDSVTLITERVNEAVENGNLTQERADEILDTLEEDILERLNSDKPIDRPGRPGRGAAGAALRTMVETITTELAIEPVELVQQVRDGATPAEVIEASGGDVDAITQTVITTLTERINQAVEDGNLRQERADRMLENLDEYVGNFMNRTFGENRPDSDAGGNA